MKKQKVMECIAGVLIIILGIYAQDHEIGIAVYMFIIGIAIIVS
ncbi:MAG: hypothetical protein ACI9DM_000226 [Cyclobacteriaceae bacterium]|jgi:hypothetical protein